MSAKITSIEETDIPGYKFLIRCEVSARLMWPFPEKTHQIEALDYGGIHYISKRTGEFLTGWVRDEISTALRKLEIDGGHPFKANYKGVPPAKPETETP